MSSWHKLSSFVPVSHIALGLIAFIDIKTSSRVHQGRHKRHSGCVLKPSDVGGRRTTHGIINVCDRDIFTIFQVTYLSTYSQTLMRQVRGITLITLRLDSAHKQYGSLGGPAFTDSQIVNYTGLYCIPVAIVTNLII